MLQFLRKKQKQIFIAMAIAIIPPFVLWGLASRSADKSADSQGSLATYAGKKITIKDYLDGYKATKTQLLLVFGDNLGKIQHLLNIKEKAWDRILLLDYAQKQGIHASDDEVVQYIGSLPFFAQKGGFDQTLYKRFTEDYLKTSERSFEEQIRGSLTLDKVQAQVGQSVRLKSEEILKLYQKKFPKEIKQKDQEKIASFTETIRRRKTAVRMDYLLNTLRKDLQINQDLAGKIFN